MSKNGITEQVEDALTYPILTQQVDIQPTSPDAQGASVTRGGSLDSVAQSTIRRVLGWRFRANDTKGFTAALSKTFALKEVEGHVEWEWKPQNYMVQADLGEVTGAQASIYSRAKVAIDQALPLLDGLTPLKEDADPEDCEAIRALVRSELQDQLVPELGKPGGPVVQLVEQIFTLLVGSTQPITDLETVGGQLGELRFRFGLDRKRVNTVDEEVNLTNFLIVVDYINSLYTTWISQAKFLGRQGSAEPFLGTQLVLLSQQLEEVAESVSEAYDAMDSVFFGPAERQTTQLKLDGQPFITVAELLGWVDKFATVDGPKWLQDSGKDGVGLVASTAEQLYDLVRQASHKSKSPSSNPTRAFHTARVHRAFDVIRDGLQATFNLATQIKTVDQPRPPKPAASQGITEIKPPNYIPGTKPTSQSLNIYGFGLTRVTKAYLEPSDPKQQVLPANANAVNAVNDSQVTATFELKDAQPGIYSVILEDPLDLQISKKDAFTITVPPPAVDDVEPVTSDQEDVVRLNITGTGFQQNAAVTLELQGSNQNPSGQIIFLSSTKIVAEFDLSLIVDGKWELIVTNPDGQHSEPPFCFPIIPAPPEIRLFVPRFGIEYEQLDLTVQGCNFRPGMQVALLAQCEQTPIQCQESPEVVGSNILKARFSGASLTPAGKYFVIVTDQDRDILASSEDRLEVCPDYTDTERTEKQVKGQVTQLTLNEDSGLARLTIGGSGFQPGERVVIKYGKPVREHVAEVKSIDVRRIVAEFDLSQIMLPIHAVFVESSDGTVTESDYVEFAYPSPVVESFVPPFEILSKDLELTIKGRYFQRGVEICLQGKGLLPIKASKADILSPRTIRSSFSLTQLDMLPGLYQVVAINPDGLQHWSKEYLEILSSPKSTGAPIEQATTSSVSATDAKGSDVGTATQQAEPAESRESDVKGNLVPEPQSTVPTAQDAADVQTGSNGPIVEDTTDKGTSIDQVEPAKAEESDVKDTPVPEPQSIVPGIQEAADAPEKPRKNRTTRK